MDKMVLMAVMAGEFDEHISETTVVAATVLITIPANGSEDREAETIADSCFGVLAVLRLLE